MTAGAIFLAARAKAQPAVAALGDDAGRKIQRSRAVRASRTACASAATWTAPRARPLAARDDAREERLGQRGERDRIEAAVGAGEARGGVGGDGVERVGVGAQAIAGVGERAIEIGALAAEQRQHLVAQAAAAIGAIVVGRIADDGERARAHVGFDLGARDGEERAHQPQLAAVDAMRRAGAIADRPRVPAPRISRSSSVSA